MQTDPIGYEDQMNLYAYVGNDPLNFRDPSGLEGENENETSGCEGIENCTQFIQILPDNTDNDKDCTASSCLEGDDAREAFDRTKDAQEDGVIRRDGNGLVEGLNAPDDPTITGSGEAVAQGFGGVFGVSVATGGVADTLNPNLCSVTTVCLQFGLGLFGGSGISGGGGLSSEALKSGTVDSFGIFGNIGAFGFSGGGSLNFSEDSGGAAKGILGIGKGLVGGVQFCRSSLSCIRD